MRTRQPRRAQLFSIGQPLLTLLLTVLAAAFVLMPVGRDVSNVAAASAESVVPLADLPAAEAAGRSLVLPGQGTPHGLQPLVGPGMPAGDGRAVRLTIQGHERGYLLLPALGLRPGQRAALAVVLHQDVGSAAAVAQGLGLDRLRREGVTLAYPAGVAGAWNAGTCCGSAMTQGLDDVGFVNAVLDDVGRHVPIDSTRRALVGYSGGGMLAYRILCGVHPSLVAVVEVSGSLEAPCGGAVVLPDLLAIHGAKDGTVGLSEPIRVTHLGMAPRPVTSTMAIMTKRASCGRRSTHDHPGWRDVRWRNCRGSSTIDLQIVVDAGHGWDSVDGAERTIPFLESHLLRTV